ncbi:NapC/NirT family cytochrome c [Haliea sp.]
MTTGRWKRWWQALRRPSARYSVLTLLVGGMAIGLTGWAALDFGMEATSTEEFCLSCHEMRDNPWPQLQKTSHYNNAAGIHATCADCHQPKEFIPKVARKIEASREVWWSLMGLIDTPEKYAAHAPAMKAREIARLRANDSQECRNCHVVERMQLELQSAKAQEYHQAMASNGKTCIDCHAGIAHPDNSGQPLADRE